MSEKSELLNEVIDLVVSSVHLQHMDRSKLGADTSLRDGGLELDSVDILEVIVAIEHKYGVKVEDAEIGKKYFRTLGTIAELVGQKSLVS